MLDTTSSSMDSCPEINVDGPIRSRYRGLSWDKKHQGWRVRIYWAGKQRHVGRYEDDVVAAKAYDKSACYLYGAKAITNFGLEACILDRTEVSPFIVLAKEQAEQEQQSKARPMGMASAVFSPDMLKGQQLLQGSPLQAQLMQQQHQQRQQLMHQQQQLYSQQQQPVDALTCAAADATALQAHTLQAQHQLLNGATQLRHRTQQQIVMLPPSVAAMDTPSSMSCSASAAASHAVTAPACLTVTSSKVASRYVLCSTSDGQQVLLQLRSNDNAILQQQQQQQLLVHQQQQQAQQQAFMFANNSSQPLQLSATPQLATVAGHMSAAAVAAAQNVPQQQQHPWHTQVQDLLLSLPMTFTASGVQCSLPMAPAAAQTAAFATATAMSVHAMPGTACTPEPSNMLGSFYGFTGIPAATSGGLTPLQQQQQQQQQQHAASLLNGNASDFGGECGSSSCSPVVAASNVLFEHAVAGVGPALSSRQQYMGGCQHMSVMTSLDMNVSTPTGGQSHL